MGAYILVCDQARNLFNEVIRKKRQSQDFKMVLCENEAIKLIAKGVYNKVNDRAINFSNEINRAKALKRNILNKEVMLLKRISQTTY